MKNILVFILIGILTSCTWLRGPKNTEVTLKHACAIEQSGRGHCNFTNIGKEPAYMCGKMRLYRVGTEESIYSPLFCSGKVEPNSTKQVPFFIPDVQYLCSAREVWATNSWASYCRAEFVEGK